MVVGGWWLVVGGWWLVAGGWWLVVGGWWLVVGGWWLVRGSRVGFLGFRGVREVSARNADSQLPKLRSSKLPSDKQLPTTASRPATR